MVVETNEFGTGTHMMSDDIPLYEKYPALRSMPRVLLCITPSPVQRLTDFPGVDELWIKRDDLNAPVIGGNKVRALEFLLGQVRAGDTVLTLGGAGSTHVLSTALHSRRLGAGTMAMRWRHDMNDVAESISKKIDDHLSETRIGGNPLGAMVRCGYIRLTRNVHFIPVGGTTPLGVLGHVNAGLELAKQIERGELPRPERIVLPLATGGTMAGIALGLAIAGLDIEVIGARVGPRIAANRSKVKRIAKRAGKLIAAVTGGPAPQVDEENLRVVHNVYGGAYGRPLAAGTEAAATLLELRGIRLDATYSAKAFAAALDVARSEKGPTLFWLTFDGRWLTT
jgi:1-aminocyclopropane-1-carboxylate deaminase/D-cysteine desulfhydrase-like pyridoxal-dependent ACC family enzyme